MLEKVRTVRRLRVLWIPALLLILAYGAKRATEDWHYIVPVEPGKVVYASAFDGFRDEWGLYAGRLSAQILDANALRLDVDATNRFTWSVARPYFSDFDVSVQATASDGPENNSFGIIFRHQDKGNTAPEDDDYYLFLISSDGYYQVFRQLNGAPGDQRQKELSTWIPSPAVNTGIGAVNKLRVVGSGNRFQFYINGQPMKLCVPDDPNGASTYDEAKSECDGRMVDTLVDNSISYGRLGVVAGALDDPGVVADFDNFIVSGPEK
jgi:hypothetical protein